MTQVQDFGRQLGEFLGGVFTTSATSGGGAPGGVFQPDPQAEIEVRQLLTDLQSAFTRKDADYIVGTLADDFATYELGAADGEAVTITQKADMAAYLETLFPGDGETQTKTIGVSRVVANGSLGLTLEDGDVVINRADGTFEHQPLRASAVAVRTADGWKWLHWHMSAAAPRFRVNANGVRVDLETGAPLPAGPAVSAGPAAPTAPAASSPAPAPTAD